MKKLIFIIFLLIIPIISARGSIEVFPTTIEQGNYLTITIYPGSKGILKIGHIFSEFGVDMGGFIFDCQGGSCYEPKTTQFFIDNSFNGNYYTTVIDWTPYALWIKAPFTVTSPQPPCENSIKDNEETDIDCGGRQCEKCEETKSCLVNTDCLTDYCNSEKICAKKTCENNIQDEYEEGIDCGWACNNECQKCIPVINNGNSDDKIDVVFVGSGFQDINSFAQVVDEAISYDEQIEPTNEQINPNQTNPANQITNSSGDYITNSSGDYIYTNNKSYWCNGADINQDGNVTSDDVYLLINNWARGDCSYFNNWCNKTDINQDGVVTSVDIFIVTNHQGIACSGPPTNSTLENQPKISATPQNNYGLMHFEPFKSNKDKFNFWRIDELKTFNIENYESESYRLAKQSCPQMDQFILLSIEPQFVSHAYTLPFTSIGKKKAFVTIGCQYLGTCEWPLTIDEKTYATQIDHILKTIVHEFGHSFGGLSDEYSFGKENPLGPLNTPNCDDTPCNKWSDITGTECIKNCGYGNWYRAYPSTIMKSQFSEDAVFRQVNENELLKDISENSNLIISLESSQNNYGLTYIIHLNYNQEEVSFSDIKLVSGTSPENTQGDYTAKIISFNSQELHKSNFGFSLEASYSPSLDWFNENGEQIVIPDESSIIELTATDESFSFPYFNNAEKIDIYKQESFLFSIDISKYQDLDEDQILGIADNCPFDYNPSQKDSDGDNIGDACESIELNLKKGNNLVSIPLIPKEPEIEKIFASIIDKIISIESFNQGAKTYDPQFPEFSDLNEINYKNSYLINLNQDADLTIYGSVPNDKTINLNKGWNLISYLCSYPQKIQDVFSEILDKIIIIETIENNIKTTYQDSTSDLQDLKPNQGYWIKTNEKTIIDYEC